MKKNINDWAPPEKPSEITESRLIQAFLDGTFPVGSNLPGERELSQLLGVTRPTLRETLQRLEKDGWVTINHGKPTHVNNFLEEGKLGVSIALAQYQKPTPSTFVTNLLAARVLLAPTYAYLAVRNDSTKIAEFVQSKLALSDDAQTFALFDWKLHWTLAKYSGNYFFVHLMNSIQDLYAVIGAHYFESSITKEHSLGFYSELKNLVENSNADQVKILVKKTMQESCDLWESLTSHQDQFGPHKNEVHGNDD